MARRVVRPAYGSDTRVRGIKLRVRGIASAAGAGDVMKTIVHSSQLQFTRDGRTLVVVEPDAVTLIELRDDARQRIALPGAQAIAAFADQIWVATRAGAVIRFARDGRQLEEHAVPTDPSALLIPTTIGPPAALWTARAPVMVLDDLGSLAV